MEGYKSGGGISGWADKQTDGDREATHCGLTNQKGGMDEENCGVCVYVCASALMILFLSSYTEMSYLTDMIGHLDVTEVNRFHSASNTDTGHSTENASPPILTSLDKL